MSIFNWFKKKEQVPSIADRLALLEANLHSEQHAKEVVEAKLLEASAELVMLREVKKEHEDKKNSPEPWVEVIGESIDPVRGIEIRLDWNDAFIQYLKESGINSKDEDAAVQKWLAYLYQDLMEKFEQRIIDNSDKKSESEYL
jgi:hypothetical protein